MAPGRDGGRYIARQRVEARSAWPASGSMRTLREGVWLVRELGSGTREATDQSVLPLALPTVEASSWEVRRRSNMRPRRVWAWPAFVVGRERRFGGRPPVPHRHDLAAAAPTIFTWSSSRQTAHRFAAGICRTGIWRNAAMKCDSIEVSLEQLASRRSKLIHAPSTRFTAGSPAQMPDANGEVKLRISTYRTRCLACDPTATPCLLLYLRREQ